MSLEVSGLRFSYPGGEELFDGLSLAVSPGERVALLGASGRGKTTLCRLLAGYLEPVSGEVQVDDSPLVAVRRLRGQASPVQLLWQHPEQAFDPRLRIGRSVQEVAGLDEDRLEGLLGAFGVRPDWLSRRPHELSGGELMRVAMVRALVSGPRYLVADESTAMLDPSPRRSSGTCSWASRSVRAGAWRWSPTPQTCCPAWPPAPCACRKTPPPASLNDCMC